MTNEEALGWFERRAESFTLSDRCQQAEDIAIKAIRTLIAQQPRVLTLEEVLGGDECWIEGRSGACGYGDALLTNDAERVEFYRTHTISTLDFYEYGRAWRCWDRRPTDEQREAAKWDE